jgi:hypothetical protein
MAMVRASDKEFIHKGTVTSASVEAPVSRCGSRMIHVRDAP